MGRRYVVWVSEEEKVILCSRDGSEHEGFERLSFPSRRAMLEYLTTLIDKGYKIG